MGEENEQFKPSFANKDRQTEMVSGELGLKTCRIHSEPITAEQTTHIAKLPQAFPYLSPTAGPWGCDGLLKFAKCGACGVYTAGLKILKKSHEASNCCLHDKQYEKSSTRYTHRVITMDLFHPTQLCTWSWNHLARGDWIARDIC